MCCDRGPVAVRSPRAAGRPGSQRVGQQTGRGGARSALAVLSTLRSVDTEDGLRRTGAPRPLLCVRRVGADGGGRLWRRHRLDVIGIGIGIARLGLGRRQLRLHGVE